MSFASRSIWLIADCLVEQEVMTVILAMPIISATMVFLMLIVVLLRFFDFNCMVANILKKSETILLRNK